MNFKFLFTEKILPRHLCRGRIRKAFEALAKQRVLAKAKPQSAFNPGINVGAMSENLKYTLSEPSFF